MVGQNDELACVYAALILADDKVTITVISLADRACFLSSCIILIAFISRVSDCCTNCFAIQFTLMMRKQSDKLSAILKAAGYDVEPYWPGLFANALEGVKVHDLISSLGAGAAAPAAAAPAAGPAKAAAAAPAAKKEEPKKEEKKEEEEDDDMGFGTLISHVLPTTVTVFVFYTNRFRFISLF